MTTKAGMSGIIILLLLPIGIYGQTTNFTYQGKLTDGGNPASGNYDLQFKLFDTLSGGTQVGTTQTLNTVAVSNGVFTMTLDFGAPVFNGASRWLEIGVRPAGSSGPYTLLAPRQAVTSTPYAIQSLNATQLAGVPANQYVTVANGATNFIQNTTTPQAASNFNISGNGTASGTLSADTVNVTTQYNIAGVRILSSPGDDNTFVGRAAGQENTSGARNAFFGALTGQSNTIGSFNSFFGMGAGRAGFATTTGNFNSFFGYFAGNDNVIGSNNTAVGREATVGANLNFATAVGAFAQVDQSDSLVLGAISGFNGATTSTKVGIGTTTPNTRLTLGTGVPWTFSGWTAALNLQNVSALGWEANASGQRFGIGQTAGGLYFFRTPSPFGNTANQAFYDLVISDAGFVGINTVTAPARNFHVNGRARVGNIPLEASAAQVCFNNSGDLLQCGASSLRLKQNVRPYPHGLDIVRHLRPISFDWKEDGRTDIGLGAEDVARVAPTLTFTNEQGEPIGVKYEKLSLLLINALQEQQAQIERQRELIERQDALAVRRQQELNALKKLVCRSHRRARLCR